jgi:hypothetical protein
MDPDGLLAQPDTSAPDHDDADIEGAALMLWSASWSGRDEELPRNRPASLQSSETELRKLHELAGKLADHIEAMRQPAIAALYAEGAGVFDIVPRLRDLQQDARDAFGDLKAHGSGRGAGVKAEAAAVTEAAAWQFERRTGEVVRYTSDPDTGAKSQLWPEFLRAVLDALGIKASIGSQVQKHQKLNPPKQAI